MNKKINQTYKAGCLVLISILIAGCGPSEAELNATSTYVASTEFAKMTAEAPTPTLTATLTATPTPIPTSTPTPTFTPTPTPSPEAHALLSLEDLELPSRFRIVAPADEGLAPGDYAYSYGDGSRTVTVPIEGSFYFRDEEAYEQIFGYTVLLPTADDRELFSFFTEYFQVKDMLGGQTCGYEGSTLISIEKMTEQPNVGEVSLGTIARCSSPDFEWPIRMNEVVFRQGKIGFFVLHRHRDDKDPIQQTEDISKAYLNRVLNPEAYSCELVSAEPIPNATWPAFEYVAQGFVPFEPRIITLTGDAIVGGEITSTGTYKLGLGGESADENGIIEGRIDFGIIEGDNVSPPSDLELYILGRYSGCEITSSLKWP